MKVVRTVATQHNVEMLTYPDLVEWREEAADNCDEPGKSERSR